MNIENCQWKLPLPNTTSAIRNILTVQTYLSFLAVYPMMIDYYFFNPIPGAPQGFMMIILSIIAAFITLWYAFGITPFAKKNKKWYWIVTGALALLLITSIFFGGFLLNLLYLLILVVTPIALATMFMGYISPILWVILGFRKQKPSIIEAEFTPLEESESLL